MRASCHNKSLSIIEAICRVGLLLTPEKWEFPPERVSGGPPSNSLPVFQKRLCFTDLSPSELNNHASYFGPFALEYEITTLRNMGAMPAIYIPAEIDSERGYSGSGVSLVNRLHELDVFLDRVQRLRSELSEYPKDQFIRLNNTNAGNQGIIGCTFGGLIDLFSTLEEGNRDIDTLKNSLAALFGLIKQTDGPGIDDLLIHYREREWRITKGFNRDGISLVKDLTEEDKIYLADFAPIFRNDIEMKNGKLRYVDACYTLKTYEKDFVPRLAKRLIAPKACINKATAILSKHSIDIEVSALEEL